MTLNDVLSILNDFGINAQTRPFLILGAVILFGFFWINHSLGKPLNTLKDNLLVVVTFLTSATGRTKLDPTLIKQMSPLQIQPNGLKILEESGFIEIFNLNRSKFFSVLETKKPTTKLEVESLSIYSFLEIMGTDGLLNKVKAYLYQKPDKQEVFPTLAGLYIRDEYLVAHKEIIQ